MDKLLKGRKTKSSEVHQTNMSVSSLSVELEGVLCFLKTLTLRGHHFNFCGAKKQLKTLNT